MPDENNSGEYPPKLKTATRAEFVTMIRSYKKQRKGCPLTALAFVGITTGIVYGIWFLYTHVIIGLLSIFIWAAANTY